jgi:acyl carrier protein
LLSETAERPSIIESSNSTDLQSKIMTAICEVKEQPELAQTLTGSTNLADGIGIDSLQMTNLILAIEESCGVVIDFDTLRLEHFHSVDTLTAFVAAAPRA